MSGFSYTTLSRAGSSTTGEATPYAIAGFGEMLVVQPEPTAQGTFVHGINNITFVTGANGIGSVVTAASGTLSLSSGNSTSGSAFCELKRGLKYRPGEGSACRLTSIFGPPVAGTRQLCGVGNSESGYYFGYSGETFGVFHKQVSGRELRQLTISVGVATTTNVTVTLNGSAITVPIAGGSSTAQTAAQIASKDYMNVGSGWQAEALGSTVYFIARRAGSQSGSYSATGTGLTATFAQVAAGFNETMDFVSQSQWNFDTMDGTGPSRFTIDPQLGNVYQVQFQYLGYGNALFSVEDPRTGKLAPVHTIRNANARTTPVLRDPQVHAGWAVENNGSAIATHMSGASAVTFTEGKIVRNIGLAYSINASKSSITTAVPILSLRASSIYKNKGCYGEIDLSSLSAACIIGGSATRSSRIFLYKNAALTGPTNWTAFDSAGGRSIAAYDTASTGFSLNNGFLMKSFLITNGQTIVENLIDFNLYLASGETLTVVGEATDSSTIDVSLSWFEDQ